MPRHCHVTATSLTLSPLQAQASGLKVMVLTGDKTETAVSIARTTGLLGPLTKLHRLDQVGLCLSSLVIIGTQCHVMPRH